MWLNILKIKNYFLIGITLITLLSSCQEDIKVNLPSAGRKIVIEGNIENGKFAELIITRNKPLFSSISSTTLSDYMVLDAQVYVTNGIITDTLSLSIDSAASLPVVYQGHSIIGIPGQSYGLTVIADGKTYTSTTTIPTPVPLDSVWFMLQPPNDSLGFAWARMSEPAGFGNGYKWSAKRATKDRRFIAPYGATTDDKWVDGKTFDFYYYRGNDPTAPVTTDSQSDHERGYYKIGDTIYVKLCSIDHATTNFYETFEQSVGTNGNPFASPVTILGNIFSDGEEQLGIWAGFGATYDTIYAH